jgi:hypothetical protein
MGEFFIDFFELAVLSGTSDPTRLLLSGKKLLLSSLTFPRSVKKDKTFVVLNGLKFHLLLNKKIKKGRTTSMVFLGDTSDPTTLFFAFSVVLHLMLFLLILPTTLSTNHSKHVETSYIVLKLTFSVTTLVDI